MNLFRVLAFALSASVVATAHAQAAPTASRGIEPTVYVLMTGAGTGISGSRQTQFPGSKNLGITAGLTVDVYTRGPFRLGADVRGTYPFISGKLASQRDLVGGVRVSYDTDWEHTLRPYLDVHAGRGQINYVNGYAVGNLLYQQTASTIYGGGGGVEFDLTRQFSLKADAQTYHWNVPVVTSGSAWSAQGSIGIAYRLFAGAAPQ